MASIALRILIMRTMNTSCLVIWWYLPEELHVGVKLCMAPLKWGNPEEVTSWMFVLCNIQFEGNSEPVQDLVGMSSVMWLVCVQYAVGICDHYVVSKMIGKVVGKAVVGWWVRKMMWSVTFSSSLFIWSAHNEDGMKSLPAAAGREIEPTTSWPGPPPQTTPPLH